MEQIEQMWISKGLSITQDRRVFDADLNEWFKEYYSGRIVYRKKGSSKRVSKSSINKFAVKQHKIIQYYCPF